MKTKRDIVIEFLQVVASVLGDSRTFTEEAAMQIEQQIRNEYGGEEAGFIAKTSDHKVGRPATDPAKHAAIYADAITNKPTEEILQCHGISRATLYRLVKKGPPKDQA